MQNPKSKEYPFFFFFPFFLWSLESSKESCLQQAAQTPGLSSLSLTAHTVVGRIIGTNSPTAEVLYLGHHYPVIRGQVERGGVPAEAVHFLPAAIEVRKRTASPVLLQLWNALHSAQPVDRDLHDQI